MRCTNIIYSSRMTRMKRPSLKSLSVMIFPDVGLLNPWLGDISLELRPTHWFVLPNILVMQSYGKMFCNFISKKTYWIILKFTQLYSILIGMFIWQPGLKSIFCRLEGKDLPIYQTFKTKFMLKKMFLGVRTPCSL